LKNNVYRPGASEHNGMIKKNIGFLCAKRAAVFKEFQLCWHP